jgi:hypothetical protein
MCLIRWTADDILAVTSLNLLAEREGFEPSAEENPCNGLAGRPVQPLQHLSKRYIKPVKTGTSPQKSKNYRLIKSWD